LSSDKIIDRISELIIEGIELHGTEILYCDDPDARFPVWIYKMREQIRFEKWIQSSLNLIRNVASSDSYYYKSFPVDPETATPGHFRYFIAKGLGVLTSLKEELERGFVTEVANIISADLLTSISDQAVILINAGYKDAAAVYCRVMVETSLKKICDKHNLEYPIKTNINRVAEILRKNNKITQIEWRQIQSWADIGNSAAHGEFDKYSINDVKLMIDNINYFIKKKLT